MSLYTHFSGIYSQYINKRVRVELLIKSGSHSTEAVLNIEFAFWGRTLCFSGTANLHCALHALNQRHAKRIANFVFVVDVVDDVVLLLVGLVVVAAAAAAVAIVVKVFIVIAAIAVAVVVVFIIISSSWARAGLGKGRYNNHRRCNEMGNCVQFIRTLFLKAD